MVGELNGESGREGGVEGGGDTKQVGGRTNGGRRGANLKAVPNRTREISSSRGGFVKDTPKVTETTEDRGPINMGVVGGANVGNNQLPGPHGNSFSPEEGQGGGGGLLSFSLGEDGDRSPVGGLGNGLGNGLGAEEVFLGIPVGVQGSDVGDIGGGVVEALIGGGVTDFAADGDRRSEGDGVQRDERALTSDFEGAEEGTVFGQGGQK